MRDFDGNVKMLGKVVAGAALVIGLIPLLTGNTMGAIYCTAVALFFLEFTR